MMPEQQSIVYLRLINQTLAERTTAATERSATPAAGGSGSGLQQRQLSRQVPQPPRKRLAIGALEMTV